VNPTSQQLPTGKASAEVILRGHRPIEFRGQRGEILSLLRQHKNEWVELPRLMQIAAQYNARVFELRRAGFVIENKTDRVEGQIHGWFRLVSEPGEFEPLQTGASGPARPENLLGGL